MTIVGMRAKQKWRGLGVLVFVIGVSLAVNPGIDFIFHPWGYPAVWGRGILGTWKGDFVVNGVGPVKAIYRLRHELYKDEGPMLEGEVYHCSPSDPKQESTLGGRVSWLGKEVQIADSSSYGKLGKPESFVCQYNSDLLTCVMDFSRKHGPELEKLAKLAGIQFQREPIRFAMVRAREGERPSNCPAVKE